MSLILLVACAPNNDSTVESRPGIDTPTFEVEFTGDTETFTHAMLTCVSENDEGVRPSEGPAFDSDGWAAFTITCSHQTYFNVWDSYGGNTNPEILEGLNVYSREYTLVPAPTDPFDSVVGWPYAIPDL